MIREWKSICMAALLMAFPIATQASAQQPPPPDNTKVNTRDRRADQKTADQQKNNKEDLETTRQIRKAIVEDKSLSTYAHNVKVITVGGKVTLKGPVKTADEKATIEKLAAQVAGATNVIDQIAIQEEGAAPPSHKTHHKPAKVNP